MREHHHHQHQPKSNRNGHEHHVEAFRSRFWLSLVFTVPILALDPMIQQFLGFSLTFSGAGYVQFAFASADEARRRQLTLPLAQHFTAILGKGAEAEVDGRKVKVVSPGYLRESGMESALEGVSSLREQAKTVVFVLVDDEVVGAVALADVIREESRTALARLKGMGIRAIMLTGDAIAVAKSVAEELGLDDYFAEVLPHEKSEKIREVKSRGLTVAMVGDGVNDAPALVEADVGVAIGAGTDVAIESADIILVRSDPRDVPAIITLARSTYNKMVQNLWWAAGYNILAIPLAAGVLSSFGVMLSPAMGAVLMSASTVIVALNAQLLWRAGSALKTM